MENIELASIHSEEGESLLRVPEAKVVSAPKPRPSRDSPEASDDQQENGVTQVQVHATGDEELNQDQLNLVREQTVTQPEETVVNNPVQDPRPWWKISGSWYYIALVLVIYVMFAVGFTFKIFDIIEEKERQAALRKEMLERRHGQF